MSPRSKRPHNRTRHGGAPATDVVYLVRNEPGQPAEGRNKAPEAPAPSRKIFVGSERFFVAFVLGGVILGLAADFLLAAMRSGQTVVWTERSLTWSVMLFAIIGALVGAVLALVVDAVAHRRPSSVSTPHRRIRP